MSKGVSSTASVQSCRKNAKRIFPMTGDHFSKKIESVSWIFSMFPCKTVGKNKKRQITDSITRFNKRAAWYIPKLGFRCLLSFSKWPPNFISRELKKQWGINEFRSRFFWVINRRSTSCLGINPNITTWHVGRRVVTASLKPTSAWATISGVSAGSHAFLECWLWS